MLCKRDITNGDITNISEQEIISAVDFWSVLSVLVHATYRKKNDAILPFADLKWDNVFCQC